MSDINEIDEYGSTDLHRVTMDGDAQAVKALIDAGAAVEAKDSSGWTALHWAAQMGNTEPSILLLQAGADISIADIDGNIARDIAISNDHHTWVSQIDAWCAANEARMAVDKLLQSGLHDLIRSGVPHA